MSTTVPSRRRHRMTVTTGGGEDRKLFDQFGGAAMGTGCPFPIAGANKDFAVMLAFFAMKFVNRHGSKLCRYAKISSTERRAGILPARRWRSYRHRLSGKGQAGSTALLSWRQFFAVGLMVAIPADQGGVAGVGKKKLQRRRFDMAVAKDHIGSALMTGIALLVLPNSSCRP